MHGLIANQLRTFVVTHQSRDAWNAAVRKAGARLSEGPIRLSARPADEDIIAVVVALAGASGVTVDALLEEFGAFLAGGLLRVYSPLVPGDWRTLDVVEHAEQHIHTAVRLKDPDAGPPYLTATRVSPLEVHVVYTSARRLCKLAEGIVRGLSMHFGEAVTVRQPECMLRGDARCLIEVRQLPS